MATPQRALNVALWIVQVLLAVGFGMAGVMKSTLPIAELAPKIPWASAVPEALLRFIGGSELLRAGGVVLPAGHPHPTRAYPPRRRRRPLVLRHGLSACLPPMG